MHSLMFVILFLANSFALAEVKENTFAQSIDHMNPHSTIFAQRYFVDKTYSQGNELSPIVLKLCGSSECSLYVSENSLPTQIAKETKATIIALEHRYYGKSLPFPNLKNTSLQFLSVEQALLDIQAFQRGIDPQNKRKWFIIGSSYAGTLAAFYRQRFPDMTVGALSSSAPVRAEFSFVNYDKYTSDRLGPQCSQKVRTLVAEIEEKINKHESLEDYRSVFKVPYIKDDFNFLFLISEFTTAIVQYGMGDSFCETVDQIGTLEAVAFYINEVYADGQGYDFSTWGFETIGEPKGNDIEDVSRPWWYQMCREMGFFQVANPSRNESVRSEILDIDFFKKICQENFGIQSTQTEQFNQKYYDPIKQGKYSRIIFTNGTEDPWVLLSILPTSDVILGNNSYAWINVGGSHSSELESADSKMNELQQKIISTATNWILQ